MQPANTPAPRSRVLGTLSVLTPLMAIPVGLIAVSVADGYGKLGAAVLVLFGAGLIGTLLAVAALIRRERWPWLGVLGLLAGLLPSLILLGLIFGR